MRRRPTPLSLLRSEVTRHRARPVLGRLPLLGGITVALVTGGLLLGGIEVQGPSQLADVVHTASLVIVVAAFAAGAAATHDALASGMVATDRLLVGRPAAATLAHLLGTGAWLAVVAVASLAGLGAGFGAGALSQHRAQDPGAWLVAWSGATLQAVAGAGLAAGLGSAAVWLCRSAATAIGVFLGLLLVGDGLILAAAPAATPFLLPENLFALASGQVDGLNVRALGFTAATLAAVIGVATVATLAVVTVGRRDLP